MPSRFVEHTSEESYEAQQAAAAESAAPAQAQPEQERAQPQPEQAQAKTVKTCPSRSKNWFKKRTPPTETQPQPRPQQQQQQQQGQAQRISAPQIQAQGSPALDKQREATHSQQQSTSVNAAAAPSSSGPLSGTPAAQSSSPDPDDDLMPLWRDPSPILSALYPLTHFIGHRPPSHPHYPEPYRLTPTSNHPDYRAHHRFFGYLFGLGAPEVERMTKEKEEREERLGKSKASRAWGKIVRGAWVKSIDMVHTLIASWTGIVLLEMLSRSPYFEKEVTPIIIGSFGAEVVVTFALYSQPPAQPKAIIVGNSVSAIISVAVAKGFMHTRSYNPADRFGDTWAAGATSTATALFAMQLLGVTHPPGGATALLGTTLPDVVKLGWQYVPIILISSLVMMGWALIINNLGPRRYPVYWIYPGALVNPPTVSPSVVPHSPAPFSGGDGPQPAPREKKLLELHDPERSAKAPLGEGSGGWKAGSDQGRQDKNRSPEEGRGGGLHPHKERNGVMVEQNAKMKSPRTSTAAPSYPTSADLAAAINIVPVHTVAPPAAPAFYQPATATLPPSPTAPVPVRASTTPALSASASQKSAYASASASASASALAANTAGSRPSMDTSGRRSSSTRRIVRHTQAARGADVPTVPAVQWR